MYYMSIFCTTCISVSGCIINLFLYLLHCDAVPFRFMYECGCRMSAVIRPECADLVTDTSLSYHANLLLSQVFLLAWIHSETKLHTKSTTCLILYPCSGFTVAATWSYGSAWCIGGFSATFHLLTALHFFKILQLSGWIMHGFLVQFCFFIANQSLFEFWNTVANISHKTGQIILCTRVFIFSWIPFVKTLIFLLYYTILLLALSL